MCDFDDDFDNDDFIEEDYFDEPSTDDSDEPDEIQDGLSESGGHWLPDWVDIAIFGGLADEIEDERQRNRKLRRDPKK